MKKLNKKIFLGMSVLLSALIGLSGAQASLLSGKVLPSAERVVLIGWDGVNKERLIGLLREGKLPHLHRIIREGKFIDTQVTSGTTSTKSGWAEILTGYSYRITGVYDNWREYRPIPVGLTVFERWRDLVGKDRSATVFLAGKKENLGARGPHRTWPNGSRKVRWDEGAWDAMNVDPGEILSMQGEPYAYTRDHVDVFENGLSVDDVGKKALGYIQQFKDARSLLFFHFEEPDEQGHMHGEASQPYADALEKNDYWLGRIIAQLESLALYDQTLIYIVSDHGFEKGGYEHKNEPQTFLATNDKAIMASSGDRKDITPTILARWGVDLRQVRPPLEGRSLLSDSRSDKVGAGLCPGMNLIMISINNVGTEHMSLYGYHRKTTPNLDKWAQDAFVFENMFSPVSWTLPAATSVFTSLFPYTHGVLVRFRGNILHPRVRTFSQILKDSGYATAAFTGGLDQAAVFGHMRGFDTISENPSFTGFQVTLGQAEQWLAGNASKKFFLFVQGYDAHPPFTPEGRFKNAFCDPNSKHTIDPALVYRGHRKQGNQYTAVPSAEILVKSKSYQVRVPRREIELIQDDMDFLMDSYDGEVLSVDDRVSRFLGSLGEKVLSNTIVIILSEHGEMFAKHGRFGRAGSQMGNLYDEVMRVPFLLKIPGHAGRRIDGLAQLVDVMPTMLEILGIREEGSWQGKSLVPLLNQQGAVNDFIYAGALYVGKLKVDDKQRSESVNEAIRDKKWKLIHEIIPGKDGHSREETYELYDLVQDPSEFHNVVDKYPDEAKGLREKLTQWVSFTKSQMLPMVGIQSVSDGLLEEARRHGYW